MRIKNYITTLDGVNWDGDIYMPIVEPNIHTIKYFIKLDINQINKINIYISLMRTKTR